MADEASILTSERLTDSVFKESLDSLNFSETRHSPEFSYHSATGSTREFIARDESKKDELTSQLDELGLTDIYFKAFRRDEVGETDSPRHTYVLLHGWTANHQIYSEVKKANNLTVVEEILARDPAAVVLALDGNGFGQTTFREDVTGSELGQKCTAEAYARQVDFLLSAVLGAGDEDKADIRIAGHSMGGAASYYLAAEHGFDCLAIAPAAFPTRESLDSARQIFRNDETEIRRVLETGGEQSRRVADVLYKTLSVTTGLGAKIRELNEGLAPLVGWVTQKAFQFIGPYLMGKDLPPSELKQLATIHQQELVPEKFEVVSKTIGMLGEGVDVTGWTTENLTALENVTTATGSSDVLVPPADYCSFLAVAWAHLWQKADKSSMEPVSHLLGDVDHLEIVGGHYAPVYSDSILTHLTHS